VTDFLLSASMVLATAAVMAGLALVAVRVRRRGTAGPAIGAAMAAYDEAMHSTAHDTFVELREQDDRTRPLPATDPVRRR